jgi:hypothetical protein
MPPMMRVMMTRMSLVVLAMRLYQEIGSDIPEFRLIDAIVPSTHCLDDPVSYWS